MPSFAQEAARRSNTASPATVAQSAQQSRKSYDRTSIGNAFVWTSDSNGENGHLDSSSEFVLKSGSLHSLHTAKSGVSSTYSPPGHEGSHSRTGSLLSLDAMSLRDKHAAKENGWATPAHDESPHPLPNHNLAYRPRRQNSLTNGVTEHQMPATNGTPSAARSVSSRTGVVNGDSSSSQDPPATPADLTPQTSMAPSPYRPEPTSLVPPTHPNRHSTSSRSTYHSEFELPASSSSFHPTTPSINSQQPPRPTLQVPKFAPGRRNSQSRDVQTANANNSEDTLASDRISSPTTSRRRPSLSLARRVSRSVQPDASRDEALQDEDAARWTEAIKHRRASKRKRREEEDDDRVIVGTKVDQNHVNWVTAYNMLTGIRFTVSRTNAKLDRELTDADFEAKHKFSFDITGNELTPSAKYDFKFKDYAPWVFRHLRAKFQLDPADYLVSLTSKYILSELGSPGKSGSFFYFSRDYKYIIKTIHHAEHKLLRRILRDYYQHIENNPNTLISQFYGLHRVKMAYGRKIHFVVMNNLFPPHRDIHQMFDLKGSTIGRDFREEDLEKNPRATLKDLNWIRRNRHLEFGPMKRDVLLAQLRRDVALLQRLKIMDYSLLVGIHDLQKGNEEKLRDRTLQIFQPGAELSEDQQSNLLTRTPSRLENARKARELREIIKREKPVPLERTAAKMPDEILDERKNLVFYSDDGGFRATHETGEPGGEIYYLGVIDCLTHYGMVKKAEHFWKGLSHNRNQISPIPPQAYGERFLGFITGITKSQEEVEREAQAEAVLQHTPETSTRSQDDTRSAVEVAMEKASKQAAKTTKSLLEHPEPRDRTLSTIRSPSYDAPGGSTLPVVEEIGEGSSTGGKNSPSSGKSIGLEDHGFHSLPAPSRPPPPPPPTRTPPPPTRTAPLPPTADGNTNNHVANERPLFQRPKGPATPSSSRSSIPQSKSPNNYVASR